MNTIKKLTDLWALLSEEQKQKAIAYNGPINFGDEYFKKKENKNERKDSSLENCFDVPAYRLVRCRGFLG